MTVETSASTDNKTLLDTVSGLLGTTGAATAAAQ